MHSTRNLLIRASAGTGKTYQLSNRYLRLIHRSCPPERILATTFTRKAAGEILERIVLRLAEAAEGNDAEKYRHQLALAIGEPSLSTEQVQQMLGQLLRRLHRIRVATLDSFFGQIAHSFSLDLGLPPGWQIIDKLQDDALRQAAVSQMLDDEPQRRRVLLRLLTQGDAVRRLSQLMLDTVSDVYHMYREADDKAWECLQPRSEPMSPAEVMQLIDCLQQAELPQNKTFLGGHQKALAAALGGDWIGFVSQTIVQKVVDDEERYAKVVIPDLLRDGYRRLVRQATVVIVNHYANYLQGVRQLVQRFDEFYQRLKHQQRGLQFDDVPATIAGVGPGESLSAVAYRIDGHIDHLLLDEFQDTSLLQWDVLLPFARRITHDSSTDGSFFCVGDAKQAIYGWRGGLWEIFDQLREQLGELKEESLVTSFRSSSVVIDAVNLFFANLNSSGTTGDFANGIQQWYAQYRPHKTSRTELPGYVSLRMAADVAGETGSSAVLADAVQWIVALHRQAPDASIGVLTRRNDTVAELIYRLREAGVRASEEGGNPLSDSAGVLAILSLLQLADHPGDTVARFHLAHTALGKAFRIRNPHDDVAAHSASHAIRAQLMEQGYGAAIYGWAQLLGDACTARQWNRLQQLIELADNYQAQATLRPRDFVRYVDEQKIADPTSANVRVMTVHQSKGLQFDIVVLPDLDASLSGHYPKFVIQRDPRTLKINAICPYVKKELLPLFSSRVQAMFQAEKDRSAYEALCLMYVAMTRAIHGLYMFVASGTKGDGKSFASWLMASLSERREPQAGDELFAAGDENWIRQTNFGRSTAEVSASESPRQLTRVALAKTSVSGRRSLEAASPSGLEGGPRVRLRDLLGTSHAAGFDYGTLLHACMEQVTWLESGRPSSAELKELAVRLGTRAGLVALALEQFETALQSPAIRGILSSAEYRLPSMLERHTIINKAWQQGRIRLEARNEQPVVAAEETRILAGNIDRLVLLRQGDKILAADIIDFKTDRIDSDNDDAVLLRVAYYRPQLEAYRKAVSKMLRLQPECIAARLVFVGAALVREL